MPATAASWIFDRLLRPFQKRDDGRAGARRPFQAACAFSRIQYPIALNLVETRNHEAGRRLLRRLVLRLVVRRLVGLRHCWGRPRSDSLREPTLRLLLGLRRRRGLRLVLRQRLGPWLRLRPRLRLRLGLLRGLRALLVPLAERPARPQALAARRLLGRTVLPRLRLLGLRTVVDRHRSRLGHRVLAGGVRALLWRVLLRHPRTLIPVRTVTRSARAPSWARSRSPGAPLRARRPLAAGSRGSTPSRARSACGR